MGSERLTIPHRPIGDVSPAPFRTNPGNTLVRRGRKVYEQRRRPFITLFAERFGLMSKLRGGCVGIALMFIIWPIGLLWISLYLLEVVIVSISCGWTMATSHRYVCTYSEYLDWCESMETRQAQIHQKRLEEVVRREREANERRHAERLEAERKERERQVMRDEARRAMLDRVAACDVSDWHPGAQDPFVIHPGRTLLAEGGKPRLVNIWWPLHMAGLAYADAVTLPMNPAAQRWNGREARWETVGPNAPPMRSIALVSPTLSTPLCEPFDVDPDTLRSTVTNHLVAFILDAGGKVLYVGNPLRWENYTDPRCDEEALKKIEKLKPLLHALYKKAVSGGGSSDGWA